jgi:hypothetical protein
MKALVIWLPRILSILFIAFISIFALDAFEGADSLGKEILDFLIHLIPSALVVVALIIAWRHPALGALFFVILAVVFTFLFHTYRELVLFLMFSLPLLCIALLLLWHWKKN